MMVNKDKVRQNPTKSRLVVVLVGKTAAQRDGQNMPELQLDSKDRKTALERSEDEPVEKGDKTVEVEGQQIPGEQEIVVLLYQAVV